MSTNKTSPIHRLQLYAGDGNHPPGEPGLNVNSTAVWLKVDGQWFATELRSVHRALKYMKEIVGAEPFPYSDEFNFKQ